MRECNESEPRGHDNQNDEQCIARNHLDKRKRCGKMIDRSVSAYFCYWHYKEFEFKRGEWKEIDQDA